MSFGLAKNQLKNGEMVLDIGKLKYSQFKFKKPFFCYPPPTISNAGAEVLEFRMFFSLKVSSDLA